MRVKSSLFLTVCCGTQEVGHASSWRHTPTTPTVLNKVNELNSTNCPTSINPCQTCSLELSSTVQPWLIPAKQLSYVALSARNMKVDLSSISRLPSSLLLTKSPYQAKATLSSLFWSRNEQLPNARVIWRHDTNIMVIYEGILILSLCTWRIMTRVQPPLVCSGFHWCAWYTNFLCWQEF